MLLLFFYLHLRTCLLILQRGEWREKETERNINVREKHQLVATHTCPNQGLNPQPRHVPAWDPNPQLFGLQDDVQPTEPHQLWPENSFFLFFFRKLFLIKIKNFLFRIFFSNHYPILQQRNHIKDVILTCVAIFS